MDYYYLETFARIIENRALLKLWGGECSCVFAVFWSEREVVKGRASRTHLLLPCFSEIPLFAANEEQMAITFFQSDGTKKPLRL